MAQAKKAVEFAIYLCAECMCIIGVLVAHNHRSEHPFQIGSGFVSVPIFALSLTRNFVELPYFKVNWNQMGESADIVFEKRHVSFEAQFHKE